MSSHHKRASKTTGQPAKRSSSATHSSQSTKRAGGFSTSSHPAKRASSATTSGQSVKHSSSTTASKNSPLAEGNPNVQKKANPEKKLQPTASSVSQVSSPTIKKSGKGYVTIRVKIKNVFPRRLSDILRSDRQRAADFARLAKRAKLDGLRTSFMPGGSPAQPAEGIPDAEPFNLNFMNFLNMPAFGNTGGMYTEVTFGKDPASGPVEVLIDSGSGVTWVNKVGYIDALKKTSARMGRIVPGKEFKMAYRAGSIKGELYKDDINIHSGSDRTFTVPRFVFGVVDEKENPDVKRWRTELDIKGILGIGPQALNKNVVENITDRTKKEDLPTIIDMMKKRGLISDTIVCVYIRLPDEGKMQTDDISSVSSESDAGTMIANFHIGGVSESIYKSGTLRMIPATLKGDSASFYGIDLQLECDQNTLMNEAHGIVDSGSEMIHLPESALNNYVEVVQKASGPDRTDPVLKYNAKHKVYHISNSDFKYLRPLKFNFVKGTNTVADFLPQQQVFPPGYYRKVIEEDMGDQLYLVFRKVEDSQGSQFTLGVLWIMWYYHIMDSSQPEKRIWIADIEGQTHYKWKGL